MFTENAINQYLILNFLNSVGAIKTPKSLLWNHISRSDDPLDGLYFQSKVEADCMIFFVSVFFVMVVLFLFMILFNFLVGYISQSYEDVLLNKVRNKYNQRCTLNDEYYLFRHFLSLTVAKVNNWTQNWLCMTAFNESKYTLKKFNCFLLSADFRKYEDQRENMINNSVIARIRNILIDHEMEIAHDLIKNKTKIESVKNEIATYRKEMLDLSYEISQTKDMITSGV